MARFKYNFWLDDTKSDDRAVAATIATLKKQRAFSAVLRDGIMIVSELRQGKTDLLLKLYPWIADAVRPSAPASTPDSGKLENEIRELKQIIMSQGANIPAPPADYPVMKSLTSGAGQLGSKPLASPKLALPMFDDDDELPTIIVRKSENTDSAANFVRTMASLQ